MAFANCYYIQGHSSGTDFCSGKEYTIPPGVELRFLTIPDHCSDATVDQADMESTVYSMVSMDKRKVKRPGYIYNAGSPVIDYNITFNEKEVRNQFYGIFNVFYENLKQLQWEQKIKDIPHRGEIRMCLSEIIQKLIEERVYYKGKGYNVPDSFIIVINICRSTDEDASTYYTPYDNQTYRDYYSYFFPTPVKQTPVLTQEDYDDFAQDFATDDNNMQYDGGKYIKTHKKRTNKRKRTNKK